jgi:hypothetical protein
MAPIEYELLILAEKFEYVVGKLNRRFFTALTGPLQYNSRSFANGRHLDLSCFMTEAGSWEPPPAFKGPESKPK